MKFVIMRHGQAEYYAPSDAERPLTEQGKDEVLRTARMLHNRYSVANVLTSPYLRAKQTADHLASELNCPIRTVNELAPGSDAVALIHQFSGTETVVLVSHMPLVSKLTGLLCEGSANAGPSFRTGAAAVIDCETIGMGTGQLIDVIDS
ncbi:MAG: phosphohistidine phosphatase SixA [Endozoicomonas sp. (ex Botrylloides leachii)]|nr:phosphohistidine phosphatase SixA [Endozoicomonas sp. (ex Botrylloides leachii)]